MGVNPNTSNGSISKETSIKIRLDLLILIIALFLSIGANWMLVKSHISDCNIHHSLEQLDGIYVVKDVNQAKLDEILRIANSTNEAVKEDSRRITELERRSR
jgi:hypothetical protein